MDMTGMDAIGILKSEWNVSTEGWNERGMRGPLYFLFFLLFFFAVKRTKGSVKQLVLVSITWHY